MKRKLVHHRNFRTLTIYDGSIRRPRTGADNNKSVGLKVNSAEALNLLMGIGRYLAWNLVRKVGGSGDAPLTITSFKYNKGPSGHATTLTSQVKA